MKVGSPTLVGCKGVAVAIAIVAGWLFAPAYCQTPSVALFLQQTPAQGGVMTPIAGVHHFVPGSQVNLTATPQPGYQFVHWLGDVSDPTTNRTVVYLDKPKIVVAVFEQIEYGILSAGESAPVAGGGVVGGGLMSTAGDYGRPVSLSAGGAPAGKPKSQRLIYSDSDEGAAEVPEPASGALLILGSLFAFARRGRKRLAR